MAERSFVDGEIFPQKIAPFIENNALYQTRLADVPVGILPYLSDMYAKDTPSLAYMLPHYCWVSDRSNAVNSRGDPYPRIEVDGVRMSFRRYIAGLWFALDEMPEAQRVFVHMSCGNPDCLNPRHMRFANRSRIKFGSMKPHRGEAP